MLTKKQTFPSQNDPSHRKMTFTNEPLWFRLVVIILIPAAAIALILEVRQYVLHY